MKSKLLKWEENMQAFRLKWEKLIERGLFLCILVNLLIQEMIEKNYGSNGKVLKFNLVIDKRSNST
jgi:hypothetical protein